MTPTKEQEILARKAIGRALFGGDAYAIANDDETTFCQTQKRLVEECAQAIALAAGKAGEK